MALSRSLLFVPAHVKKMLDKALGLTLDATILDLENAVPPRQKAAARDGARTYISTRPGHAFVRINPLTSRAPFTTAFGGEDLAAVVTPRLRGVVVPKVETAEDLEAVDETMAHAECRAGLAEGEVELYWIVETARGALESPTIARTRMRRPHRLCFGAGDFTRDIGVEWSREERESFTARSMNVLATRAAGVPAPIRLQLEPEQAVRQHHRPRPRRGGAARARRRVPLEQITLSSDANVSMSVLDGQDRPVGLHNASPRILDREWLHIIRTNRLSLPQALPLVISSVARVLGIDDRKGSLAPGKDADVVVLTEDLMVDTVHRARPGHGPRGARRRARPLRGA